MRRGGGAPRPALWRGLGGRLAERELRRRLELVADAEHELRGPLTVLALVCERMRRENESRSYAEILEAQLARLRIAIEDLGAARCGALAGGRVGPQELRPLAEGALAGWRAGASTDWQAGGARVVADRGRLAQALGNLVANAAEHGDGPVRLSGRLVAGAVRVEVRNRAGRRRAPPADGRGRGLRIAGSAAATAGGRLELDSQGDEVIAALELPVEGPTADAA